MIDAVESYLSQSRFTDPGSAGSWLDRSAADVSAIREMSAQLVFHYWANGDIIYSGFRVPPVVTSSSPMDPSSWMVTLR